MASRGEEWCRERRTEPLSSARSCPNGPDRETGEWPCAPTAAGECSVCGFRPELGPGELWVDGQVVYSAAYLDLPRDLNERVRLIL